MTEGIGNFEPHLPLPCRCVDCLRVASTPNGVYSGQLIEDLISSRNALAIEVEQLRGCNANQAQTIRQLEGQISKIEASHRSIIGMMDVEIAGAMDDFKRAKVERDSQATLAAVYLRERDALKAELATETVHFTESAVEAEREACAKVADAMAERWDSTRLPIFDNGTHAATAVEISDAIRDRGGK